MQDRHEFVFLPSNATPHDVETNAYFEIEFWFGAVVGHIVCELVSG